MNENEVYILDIFDKLPDAIQSLIGSEDLENISENISSVVKLEDDQSIDFISLIVSVLMGQYSTDEFKKQLKGILIDDNKIEIVFNYLNQKIFGPLENDLRTSQNVYNNELMRLKKKEEKETMEIPIESNSSNVVDYIKKQAEEIRKHETPKIVEKQEETNAIKETDQNTNIPVPEIKPIEAIEPEKPKPSILLQSMLTKDVATNRLGDYYKTYKSQPVIKEDEKKDNVFQPPFKVNRAEALVEFDNTNEDFNKNIPENPYQREETIPSFLKPKSISPDKIGEIEVLKDQPTKYQHIKPLKTEKEEEENKSLFIDLAE